MINVINDFNNELVEEIHRYLDEHSCSAEGAFTSIFLSYLTEHGETRVSNAEIVYCYNSIHKFKINAYVYDEYFQTLTLVISLYNNRNTIEKINKSDVAKNCKYASKFYKLCSGTVNIFDDMEESSDSYQLYEYISSIINKVDNVSVILITNKQLKSNDIPEDTYINKTPVKYDVWDIERLAKAVFQKKETDQLIIRIKSKYKYILQLIKVPQESNIYDSYVGYISGTCLAEIYKDEGQRLIEKNVRSFLQATGKVNRGIRDTLKNNPDMFMAYNNGISTIAEGIVADSVSNDGTVIRVKELIGWQIVNGGQTTASIYTALQNKVSLDNVNVQIKLTIVKDINRMGEVVSNISKYANSQNNITMSDFSANDDFHIELERLSRKIYIPVEKGTPTQRWFYERARGQYMVEVNRNLTSAEKKKFKADNPKQKCISKTVAAKCTMCWMKYPYIVSKGLETNFVKYSEMIQNEEIGVPDEKFYCRLIAQVILFQECDRIVDAQNFGGYKANINYYTIALLSEFHSDMVDFDDIWKSQNLSLKLSNKIKDISYCVWNHFMNPDVKDAKGVNVTQWCKKEECWELLKSRYINGSI